ncbi:DUF317 domain-containing protein [Streptomyces nigrescens]|uniref:DUF317 domain-containing protein n=1 Tax=Streptomyces nigrescens TaxID=1920 RepID=UPI00370351BD
MSTSGSFSPYPIYAAPRHLAGGGDPRYVTAPLIALGWTHTAVDGVPELRLRSPDRRTELALTPDPDKPWWTIYAPAINPPAGQLAWHATFGGRTPAEALAGLTDALVAAAPIAAPSPWAPLRVAGWKVSEDRHVTATSPDGTATVQLYRAGAYQHWRITTEHDVVGNRHEVWSAHLSGSTPAHLIAGFTAGLADASPVLRAPDALPVLSSNRVHTKTAETPGLAEARLRDRIATARRTASRVRIGKGLRPPGLPPAAPTPGSPGGPRR